MSEDNLWLICLVTKQIVSLWGNRESVTRIELDSLLATSRAQRDYAKRVINEQFDQLDKRNNLTKWFK